MQSSVLIKKRILIIFKSAYRRMNRKVFTWEKKVIFIPVNKFRLLRELSSLLPVVFFEINSVTTISREFFKRKKNMSHRPLLI